MPEETAPVASVNDMYHDMYGQKEKRVGKTLNFLSTKALADEAPSGAGEGANVGSTTDAAVGKPAKPAAKQGTLFGVFVPCLQNILGIILFVRSSWIVGQAGLGYSLLIIFLCCSTTFLTALALSAVATNGAIKGGGPYYLISRALGPEFGGSVGLCFYLGTTVAGAMYILGAVETLKISFWPGLQIVSDCPEGITQLEAYCSGCDRYDYSILGAIILCLCASVVACGVKYVSMIGPLFLLPVLVTVLCMWLGFFTVGLRDFPPGPDGEVTISGKWDIAANWYADPDEGGECGSTDFFSLLALFFPSVTGIMAGSNRSGDLRDAQGSIPKGTVGAQLTTTTIYTVTAIFYACVASRYALKNDFLLSATVAWPHPIVVRVGIVLSTLGAGLQSLTGAPRLLQAIANDNLIPALTWFQGSGEPRRPLLLTCAICLACIIPGKIDLVAPIITMFFLLCYLAVNLVVLMQDLLREPNWRPRFKYHHPLSSLCGVVICLFIMYSTQWYFALASMFFVAALYKYVEYRKVSAHWGDGMRGLRYQTARTALLELENITSVHTKNWRPQVLVYAKVDESGVLHQPNVLEFVGQLKGAGGISIISTALEGDLTTNAATQMRIERRLRRERDQYKIRGFTQVVMSTSIEIALDSLMQTAGLGGLGPNTALVLWPTSWKADPTGARRMKQILTSANAFNMATVVLKGIEWWPTAAMHLLGTLDVWWVVHDGGLLLLLAVILRKHRTWAHCPLRVFCVSSQEDDPVALHKTIEKFLYDMRIPAALKVVQLEEGAGLDTILPTRKPKNWRDDAAFKASIVSQPLGDLAAFSTVAEGAVEEPRLQTEAHKFTSTASAAGGGGSFTKRPRARSGSGQAGGSGADSLSESSGGSLNLLGLAQRPRGRSDSSNTGQAAGGGADAASIELEEQSELQRANLQHSSTVAFNSLVQKYSGNGEASLIMTNLPLPRGEDSVEKYMSHLEELTANLPQVMLVAGQKKSDVVTMFS